VKPRLSLVIGGTFVVVGAVFYLAPRVTGGYIDFAELTMLLVLSIAMTLMFFVLMASTPNGQ